jgi:hypothetical protein
LSVVRSCCIGYALSRIQQQNIRVHVLSVYSAAGTLYVRGRFFSNNSPVMKHTYLLMLLFSVAYLNATAQNIGNYQFHASAGTFTDINTSGSTVMQVGSGSKDDGIYKDIPFGFAFTYLGNTFTSCNATTNGILSFVPLSHSYRTNDLVSSFPLLAPLWDDLSMDGGTFSCNTEPVAGDQVFTAQWLNVRWNSTAAASCISFQVKLYRNTGKISFIYRQENGALSSPSASIGICSGGSKPGFSGGFRSLYDVSASPVTANSVPNNYLTQKPATGQVYSFTPEALLKDLAVLSVGATVARIEASVTNGIKGNTNGFVVSKTRNPLFGGTGVQSFEPTQHEATGKFTVHANNLHVSSNYYFRAYTINGAGTITYSAYQDSFTTTAATIPLLATGGVAQDASQALLSGTIIADNGSKILSSGMVWSEFPNPVVGGPGVSVLYTPTAVPGGSFTLPAAALTAYSQYYYRAFATNAFGVAYSATDSFIACAPITTFPHFENFDGITSEAWTTQGTGVNDWQKGTPNKLFFDAAYSGPRAWVTKLEGYYSNNHDASVVSPVFDFSALTSDPVLAFRHSFFGEVGFDGGIVEVSVNGGEWKHLDPRVGSGLNYNTPSNLSWYNYEGYYNYTNGNPLGTVPLFSYWSGLYDGVDITTNSWVLSQARLTGMAGQSNVRVRFRYVSNATDTSEGGWAIDDVSVFTVEMPTVRASSVTLDNIGDHAVRVRWANGNGDQRLVVARHSSSKAVIPADWMLYGADAVYGCKDPYASGDSTGLDNFVVYNGTGSEVTVTGLSVLTDYTFTVYEYNGNAMHSVYAAGNYNNAQTLPVELLSFTAQHTGADVHLKWATASEHHNRQFDIERSVNGIAFTKIGEMAGAGTVSQRTDYTYNDNSAVGVVADKLYYRLKQIDTDGLEHYSHVVSVVSGTQQAGDQLSVSPNPFTAFVKIGFERAVAGPVQVTIVDMYGKEAASRQYMMQDGEKAVQVNDLDMLQPGVYAIDVVAGGVHTRTKLVKE